MKAYNKRRLKRAVHHSLGALYYAFGIGVSVIASNIESIEMQIAIIAGGVSLAAFVYFIDSERRIRRLTDDRLEYALNQHVFPSVRQEYRSMQEEDDPPDIRINIMLLRHRDFLPKFNNRWVPFWKKYMMAEFTDGDYSEFGENRIKWCVDEGVAGTAIEYSTPIDSDLDGVDIYNWDMTKNQLESTIHLGSVLSIPICTPEDEDNERPIGVLNVDSQANLEETQLDEESFQKELSSLASYLGALA